MMHGVVVVFTERELVFQMRRSTRPRVLRCNLSVWKISRRQRRVLVCEMFRSFREL
jgi:hypothetical protein